MSQGHDAVHGAKISRRVENRVEQGDQRSYAFQRKSFRAQIARLKDLFKKICPDQALENLLLINFWLGPFDALSNPSPPLRLGEVREFRTNAATVDAARFLGSLASQLQIGDLQRLENTQRVQRSFEIAPTPKDVKNALALFLTRYRFL